MSSEGVARRSCLSVPASEPAKLEKAGRLGADEVVYDLEDSVAPAAKPAARSALAAHLSTAAVRPAVAVRVNAVSTPWWEDDVRLVAGARPGRMSLVVAKVERPDDIIAVDRLLSEIEESSGARPPIGIQALVEMVEGLHRVDEIAAASSRMQSLILGYADLGAALGRAAPPRSLDPWLPVQNAVLVAARRHGLQAIDGPCLAFADEQGCDAANRRALDVGFDGKWVIHPRQIAAVNQTFTPAPEELRHAHAVIAAFEQAEREGTGAIAVSGQMVDLAVLLAARRTVARAQAGAVHG